MVLPNYQRMLIIKYLFIGYKNSQFFKEYSEKMEKKLSTIKVDKKLSIIDEFEREPNYHTIFNKLSK